MKTALFILFALTAAAAAYPQGNHVFSGAEEMNYSVMNIPAGGNQLWSTDRTATPGYFSAVNNANFTGCTDASHINGHIKKYGNTAFVFPVGSATDLRTLEISVPASTTDVYATAWMEGDPSVTADLTAPYTGFHPVTAVQFPIMAVSTAGQWDWQTGEGGNLGTGSTGTGNGLTITVSIPDMTQFATANSLRLVGWNGSRWIDLSGGPAATGNTENSSLTGTMVNGITAIAVGSITSALPLHLESFTAAADNCNALLKWRTTNEINTKYFIVEQSSDNIHFATAATVKANGSITENNYSLSLAQPSGTSYYRLKMTDNDGRYTYSGVSICHTSCDAKEFMTVYPNPVVATGTLYLRFTTQYRGAALLTITNMLGQEFYTMRIQVTGGNNLIPIEVGRFASGTYLLSVLKNAGERIGTVQKFIKQ